MAMWSHTPGLNIRNGWIAVCYELLSPIATVGEILHPANICLPTMRASLWINPASDHRMSRVPSSH